MAVSPSFSAPPAPAETRAGYVAVIGPPNAGKSTLLNRMVEQKLSIVTALPQTTRERVVGIDTRDDAQIIFVDTPGLVDPAYLLHHSMLKSAVEAVPDVDVVLFLFAALNPPPVVEPRLLAALRSRIEKVIPVVNKIDAASAEQVEELRMWAVREIGREPVAISAETGAGTAELRDRIVQQLPLSPFLYPEDEISSQPVRFFVAEMIRETVFEMYREEIPYSVATRVEEFREADEPVYIRANIFVERSSQKGILIGEKGAAIRALGKAAREKIESFIGQRVYLDLWIKVLPKWRKDPAALRRLGYSVPDHSQ